MTDKKFSCPVCGSYMFGSSGILGTDMTGHCHGNEAWSCEFSWPRSDDHKYFHETPPEPTPEIKIIRQLTEHIARLERTMQEMRDTSTILEAALVEISMEPCERLDDMDECDCSPCTAMRSLEKIR